MTNFSVIFLYINVMSVNIFPSTELNIVPVLAKSSEISVGNEQGWKPMLDICDLQAIGQCCIKNGHNSVMGITSNKTNKSLHVWGYVYIYCLWIYSLHIWKDTIGTQFFEHSSPLIFQQDNTELYTASSTTAWLCSRRVGSKLACLQTFHQLNTFKASRNKKYVKNQPELLEQSEWDDFSLHSSKLMSSISRCLWTFLRDTIFFFWDALLFLHNWKVELMCSKTD